ncbi:MAG: tetratricopeptide repeat protein [Rhodocyclaceae bacterium]|nr:tetratricopeptide repeat protein [Rhodocyclaceae bacterium]
MSALEAQKAGAVDAAEKGYRELLAMQPNHADAWNNLGVLLQREARSPDALACFDRLVELEPKGGRGYANRGVVLKSLERPIEAIENYRQCLAIEPDNDSAHGNLGNLLFDQKRYPEALPHYAAACRLQPTQAPYRFMHAKTLLESGLLNQAEAEFIAMLELEADKTLKADAWGLLARIHQERHHLPDALVCFDRGVAIAPDYPALTYNRGLARLLAGHLQDGFLDYEMRFDVPGFPGRRMAESHPRWQGGPLPGGTLFLYAEQGIGDTFQFVRYLDRALDRVGSEGSIVCAVQPAVIHLVPQRDRVRLITTGDTLPPVDAVCPLMSLPRMLGEDLLDLPASIPYLQVDSRRSVAWFNRFSAQAGKLRIGLVWAGNPAHSNDANRSMPLEALAPLLDLPGCAFYSFQVGARAGDITALHWQERLEDLSAELKDYSDTAAALTHLDLLICVDTSIAHVAGALGVPVWLMLPHVPDWRWQMGRDDTPWYPSLRLFRQRQISNWTPVVAAIANTLARFLPAASPSDFSGLDAQLEAARQHLELQEKSSVLRLCWSVLRQHPFHSQAWNLLAVSAWRDKDASSAALFGARAARFNASDAANWSNLGAFLKAQGRCEEAVFFLRKALALSPANPGVLSNLGNTLAALERWDAAVASTREAILHAPEVAEYHYNLGVILRETEDFSAARAAFLDAVRLEPGHVRAQLHIALLELMLGEFDAGWSDYECRWLQPDCKEVRHFNRPLWQGENIAGKRILIHAEQGFGDTFQFLRYIPLVAARGAEVVLVVQPSLESFAGRISGVTHLVPSGERLPPCDCHCPLLSLPRALATTLENIPAEIPYLSPLTEKSAHWRERLKDLKGYRVGIVWAGRPTHGNDTNRSMMLSQFNALLSDPRFDFVSVQKGEATLQIRELPPRSRILNLDDEIETFEDTAAILCELDELLTVDTSVAHLAGALGVKTRVLLPRLPDWRWLWNRADSPWYPSLSLYRQDKRKDWSGPLVRVAQDLRAAAAEKRNKG